MKPTGYFKCAIIKKRRELHRFNANMRRQATEVSEIYGRKSAFMESERQ